ncbi:retrovirus-related pol polyprotein from transposon TNT 1-94 [Tanacetum coccineum]
MLVEGKRFRNFAKKESMKKAFQDMLHGLGGKDIFSFGSALEDFICVVFVPDRNIMMHTQVLEARAQIDTVEDTGSSCATLTWWNGHVRTLGHDAAYAMTWGTLKKKLTDKYCLKGTLPFKKPDLSFFYVFGSLCYPTNDHEDLGKFDGKADIGIFVGYAPAKKAFKIYNRRTWIIFETIHVTFDELTAMAFEQFSSGPKLQGMTPTTSSTRLGSNPVSQQPYLPPIRDD